MSALQTTDKATIGGVLQSAHRQLEAAGADTPHLDARLLMEAALGISTAEIVGHPETPLSIEQVSVIEQMIHRRARREPVSRIIGRRAFWRDEFIISPETLDPRADSETLIDAALSYFSNRPPPTSILDLGTGSGCLLISLLKEFPAAHGIGIDISPDACHTAKLNAQRLDVAQRCRMICGHWAMALNGAFDLVISNPPYIARADISSLAPEVKEHDPVAALDGGPDGLQAYLEIVPEVSRLLSNNGVLLLEFGRAQSTDIAGLVERENMQLIEIYKDFNKLDRCLLATVSAAS